MMTIVSLLLSHMVLANASDDWLCKQESSQVLDNQIYACGIGIDADENQARAKAFDNAKEEFDRVCNASHNCKYHQVDTVPKRTSCETTKGQVKCYRGVLFNIGPESPDRGLAGKLGHRNGPRIREGMTKSELLSSFGTPSSVIRNHSKDNGEPYFQVLYNGPMCRFEDSACYVIIKDDKVKSWQSFNPDFEGF